MKKAVGESWHRHLNPVENVRTAAGAGKKMNIYMRSVEKWK